MEWDQYLFKQISRLVRAIKAPPKNPLEISNAVSLAELKPRLTYLARLLCGVNINVQESTNIGGWQGDTFWLPSTYSHALDRDKNIDYYLFRVFYLYGQFELKQCWMDKNTYSEADAYAQAQRTCAEVIALVASEYPNFLSIYEQVLSREIAYQHPHQPPSTQWIYGKWCCFDADDWAKYNELIKPISKNTVADDKDKEKYSEMKGKNVENAQILSVNTQEQEEYTLTHNFEKIETLDTFSGRWRNFDGSDDLSEHAEALQELDLHQLVRVDSPVHAIYKSDFVQVLGLIEADAQIQNYHFAYPEWNETKRNYREGYCKIIYQKHIQQNKNYTQQVIDKSGMVIRQLKRMSEQYLSDYYLKKRLPDGSDPDIDAVVDAYVDRVMGRTPSEDLYIARRKKNKDIAILVLTDCSLSTDGYTANRRILDIEKEALIIAAQVWADFDLQFQIDTFSSHTHSQCFYTTYKAFHEKWSEVKYRIGDMQSSGYTRIGAALRHATYLLSQVKADKKWLLLLSDGKPNDYDTYEGNYGLADVKKAIYEAAQKQIFCSAIAIDAQAKFYFPKMFGNLGYTILNHPKQLPESLTKFYINLIK